MISKRMRQVNDMVRAVAAAVDKFSVWIEESQALRIHIDLLEGNIHPGMSKLELANYFKTLHIGDVVNSADIPSQIAQYVFSYIGLLSLEPSALIN
jgi:hypothetical protein